MDDVVIRPLETLSELKACEDLQKAVWGMPERDIVPIVELVSARTARGVVAGAFAPLSDLVGFVYGMWGLDGAGDLYHYSRMVGVRPDWRGRGLAFALKAYQRSAVLDHGVDLVRWTYDPLEGENASLNVAKLGVVVSDYIIDYYGEKTDEVNQGLPTDRFFVRWHLASPRVRERLGGKRPRPDLAGLLDRLPSALVATEGREGLPAMAGVNPGVEGPAVLLEIPASLRALKAGNPGEALAWRMAVRDVAPRLFEQGYVVTDFVSQEVDGRRRSAYVLTRED